jgi:hypothetical protein
MPSPAHETLVEFLRTQPAWLDALLRELGAPGLSRGLRAVDPAVRVVDPSTVATDVLLRDEEKPSWLVVEVQRGDDPEKRRRWIFVAAMLHDQTGVMGDVLVITHTRKVSQWSATVADVTGPLGTRLLLVPRVICLTRSVAEHLLATGRPELALFAAWAVHEHRGARAARLVLRAVRQAERLDDLALRGALVRAMINMVSKELRRHLRETLMDFSKIPEGPLMREIREEITREFLPELEKQVIARLEPQVIARLEPQVIARLEPQVIARLEPQVIARLEPQVIARLEPQVIARLEPQVRAEAEQRFLRAGALQGEAHALLRILERRGLALDSSLRARVVACDDRAVLDAWLDRAATATTVREVFDDAD